MRFAQEHSSWVAQLPIQIRIGKTNNSFINLISPPRFLGLGLEVVPFRFRPPLAFRILEGEPDDKDQDQKQTADNGIGRHGCGALLRLTPTFGSLAAVPKFIPSKLITLRMALTTLSSVSFAVIAAIIENAPTI